MDSMHLKELVSIHTASINPMDAPEKLFHLYSLPSFDENQKREDVFGRQIQSNKWVVPNRCILFNKLNVRFQRIWLIDNDDADKICSTEFLPLIVDENKIDFYYCYFLLHAPSITNYLTGQNTNTSGSHKRIDPDDFLSIEVQLPSLPEQKRIGKFLFDIEQKIIVNRQINDYLAAMARQLYDYWFVQFDFPDENGKPYKSSGGKMTWNEKLKREIPEGWRCGTLLDIASYTNGIACQNYRPKGERKIPVIKIKEMHDGFSSETEFVRPDIPDSVKIFNGDVLFSWSASLEVVLWAGGNGGLNQHIFKVTSKNGYPRSFYYYQLLDYIAVFKQMAEARKTTMGHITRDHLEQSTIALPPSLDLPNRFESKISPVFQQYIANQQDIDQNIRLRIELLPLLMNGQVSVKPLNNHLSHD